MRSSNVGFNVKQNVLKRLVLLKKIGRQGMFGAYISYTGRYIQVGQKIKAWQPNQMTLAQILNFMPFHSSIQQSIYTHLP